MLERHLCIHCDWRLSCVCVRSDLLKMDNPPLYPEILLNSLPVSLQEFSVHFCSVNAFIMWHLLQVCSTVNNLDHDLCQFKTHFSFLLQIYLMYCKFKGIHFHPFISLCLQVLQQSVQVSNTGFVTSVLSSFKTGLTSILIVYIGFHFGALGLQQNNGGY